MKSLWKELSENQQEWVYTLIGLLFFPLGLGWLIIFYSSVICYVAFFVGVPAGLFLKKGKLKRYIAPLIKPSWEKTEKNRV